MKKGIEIRPNGVKITKVGTGCYKVEGSQIPHHMLWSARQDADSKKQMVSRHKTKPASSLP